MDVSDGSNGRVYVEAFLKGYAWSGTDAEKRANIECIMSQDGWKYLDITADSFASAQFESGPDVAHEGMVFALSALYECHDGPHIANCPYA